VIISTLDGDGTAFVYLLDDEAMVIVEVSHGSLLSLVEIISYVLLRRVIIGVLE